MLVLTRKKNQSIDIGGGIRVTVLKVSGGKIRLGVKAPKDLQVLRSELAEELRPADHPPASDAAGEVVEE